MIKVLSISREKIDSSYPETDQIKSTNNRLREYDGKQAELMAYILLATLQAHRPIKLSTEQTISQSVN